MSSLNVVERVVSTAWQAALGALAAGAETVTAHSIDWRTYLAFVLVTVLGSVVKNVAVKVETDPAVKAVEPVLKAAEPLLQPVLKKVEANPVVADVVKAVESAQGNIDPAGPAVVNKAVTQVLTFAPAQ